MAVSWDSHVNTKVLRDGSSWGEIDGFIEDGTLSGKKKRRMAHSLASRQYTVQLNMTYEEYAYFKAWYRNDIKFGSLSFEFPNIDGSGTNEYRFVSGGAPRYTNQSGQIISCSMVWEEV